MSDIKLTTPDGYFARSMEKTMAEVAGIRKRRRTVMISLAAVIVVAAGGMFASQTIDRVREENEYIALQAEISRVDIFLEVNQ